MARRKSTKKKQRKLRSETLEVRRCLAASLGWDGPGQGSVDLSYYIGAAPAGVNQATFEDAIETALDVWSDVIDVDFIETSRPNQLDSIDFSATRIDGSGGTLAQAYLPDDVNPARIAGDVQFDSSENWEVGNDSGRVAFDLVQVAVHEIGHALGLDHSHSAASVLAPYVSPTQYFRGLSSDDIDAALDLYAPAPTIPATPTNDGVGGQEVGDPVTPTVDPPTVASDTTDDTDASDNEQFESTPEEDTPETNRRWRPWLRQWRWSGGWRRFGGRIIASPANHNAILPSDVNRDGKVTPVDALVAINSLVNSNANSTAASDTNADGEISPLDVLGVINDLVVQSTGGSVRTGAMEQVEPQGEEADLIDVGIDNSELGDQLTSIGDDSSSDSESSDPTEAPFGEDTTSDGEVPDDSMTPTQDRSGMSGTDETTTVDESPDVAPIDDEQTTVADETPEASDDDATIASETPTNQVPVDEDATIGNEETTTVDETDTESGDETSEETPTTSESEEHCPDRGGLVAWGVSRFFSVLDTNDDDLLTEPEAGSALWGLIQSADTDESGAISMDEIDAMRPSHGNSRFSQLDDNGDGGVTVDEVNAAIWEKISPADADDDGSVTADELDTYRDSLPSRRFRRLDDNNDGVITQDEVSATTWEYLVAMDANEDASITPDEYPASGRSGRGFGHGFRLGRFSFRFGGFRGFRFR